MKLIIGMVISLIVLMVIAFFSIDYVATNIVEAEARELKRQVEGEYEFNYKELELNLTSKSIVLREFEFLTLTDSFDNRNKFDFKIDKLFLKYDSYRDILFSGTVDIVEVLLRQPEISYGIRSHLKKSKQKKKEKEKQKNPQNGFFEKIILEKFLIESAKADIYRLERPDTKVVFVNDLAVNVNGLVLDLLKDSFYISETNEKPLFSFKEVYKNDLKQHNLSVDEIQYHFEDKELTITNFKIENKLPPDEFIKTLSHRNAWFSIKVPQLKIEIDPRYIYDYAVFYIPKLEISDADVTISNNLTLPIKPGHKPMPGTEINSIDQNFLIDSLILNNIAFKYILKKETAEPGQLKFTKLNGLATNVTDIDTLLAKNPFMDLRLRGLLWDEGKANINFRFDLTSSVDRIDVAGSLKDLPVKKAENMIKPLFGVEVKSGHIDQAVFEYTMDENNGVGKMKFDYRDLKVDVKTEDKKQNKESDEVHYTEKSAGLLNFAVNEAVRTNNTPDMKNYRPEGNIIVDRVKIKPVYDLLWNCLANGMMDIAIKKTFYDSLKSYEKKQKKEEKAKVKEEKQKQRQEQKEQRQALKEEKSANNKNKNKKE